MIRLNFENDKKMDVFICQINLIFFFFIIHPPLNLLIDKTRFVLNSWFQTTNRFFLRTKPAFAVEDVSLSAIAFLIRKAAPISKC